MVTAERARMYEYKGQQLGPGAGRRPPSRGLDANLLFEAEEPRGGAATRLLEMMGHTQHTAGAQALMTPSSRPTSTNAATALSIWSSSCAALSCTRMRALPLGTTG